ncbi:hypothetical protein U1E44_02150 [Arenibacter sp. GZD96]|uniref:hypothetical protein n=1 Tax=Aurantibrevibacter litoralis TaxID=3106030 RepID=UPI002AFF6E22|nr:hypothetical protein [Arenibacter sp. GZD-96]MEA1784881.1 hypothetical protein [Arenibacter sp. GZD-96]
MRKKLNIGIIVLIAILIQSCDPTYPISIKNNSGTEIVVDAKLTNSFNPGLTTTYIADENGRLQFKIESGQEFECGFSIAELENDLPFSELKIYTKKDTIIANNRNEVLNLFDKNWIGKMKTPYVMTVE